MGDLNNALKSNWAYALIYVLLCIAVLSTPQIRILDLRLGDLLQSSKQQVASEDILLVEIDRKTIDNVGSYPISNHFYADLLNRLHESEIRKMYLDRRLSVETNTNDDLALVEALTKLGSERIAVSGYNPTLGQAATEPIELFANKATVVGGHFYSDYDGRYRILSTYDSGGGIYPNPARWLADGPKLDDVIINQSIDHQSFRRVSAWDLLALPKEQLMDKTIIMGLPTSVATSSLTYTDGSKLDRIALIALAYESVRAGTEIQKLTFLQQLALLLLVGLISTTLLIKRPFPASKYSSRIVFTSVGILVIFAMSFGVLHSMQLQLPIVSLIAAFGIGILVIGASKTRLLEMGMELFSGDLSAEEAWAWQTASHQNEPLVLMSFNGPKRQNDPAKKLNFFNEDNSRLDVNCAAILRALSNSGRTNPTVLHDLSATKMVRCWFPFPDIPLVRLEDVTEELTQKRKLEESLHEDQLTGCLNRRGLFARAQSVVGGYSVIMMDMNGFKAVNDTLGHATGDELLRIAAKKFASVLKEQHVLARLGGDEFCVLLPGVCEKAAVQRVCNLLEISLNGQIDLNGAEAKISVATGYSVANTGDAFDDVLERADKAMYEHKAQIKNQLKLA